MIGLIGLVLSRNFLIGLVVGAVGVSVYLYIVGNKLIWKKAKK